MMVTRPDIQQRKELAAKITEYLRPAGVEEDDLRGAFAKRDTSVLIVWDNGRGDFQTLSFEQAGEYLRLLDEGKEGPPWKLGIR